MLLLTQGLFLGSRQCFGDSSTHTIRRHSDAVYELYLHPAFAAPTIMKGESKTKEYGSVIGSVDTLSS